MERGGIRRRESSDRFLRGDRFYMRSDCEREYVMKDWNFVKVWVGEREKVNKNFKCGSEWMLVVKLYILLNFICFFIYINFVLWVYISLIDCVYDWLIIYGLMMMILVFLCIYFWNEVFDNRLILF